MRTPVIAGNWKLFKTSLEARELVNGLIPLIKNAQGVEIVIAPVFTVLGKVKELLSGTAIHLAAQNCYWEEEGAFTGEISPKMLLDAGCSHVIIGHSERRQYFGETDETVNKKTKAAISAGLIAIVCAGETLAERDEDRTHEVLKRQVSGALSGIDAAEFESIIIAYEPVWAIGTGKTATDAQAQDAHAFIRKLLTELYDRKTADTTRILYGGSVKPDNVKGLMTQTDIDGALVGGASLKADSFAAIVNFGS
jgi:triosephosphate isomerase (TIM)